MMSVRIDLFSKSIVEELTEIFTIIIVMDNTRAMILMEGLSRIKEIFKIGMSNVNQNIKSLKERKC